MIRLDPSSFTDRTACVTTHLDLDLTADFTRAVLHGTATLHLDRHDPTARELILDTRALDIQQVECATERGAWTAAVWRLGPEDEALGAPLYVDLPPDAAHITVRVTYETSPAARGLQWLSPRETAGRRQPFLFSQAEAIQARSFVPLQDTPGVRITYDATLRVPPDLVALMAAESRPRQQDPPGVFHFHMPQPIPSYLIALAVGDLTFRSTGPRSGVWAEPSVVEAAAREFEDTERMIATVEALYGPYRWGRYDLLVLPPSFPFGGMENPRLTFASPTVLAGDKSLVSLVAHELAHSWSGNLTTNATWQDFWLNEGFTVYVERRVIEALYGTRRADMERVIGLADLARARQELVVPGDRTLRPDLTGRDPDEAYSVVPYEQGALLLLFLESRFGREALDIFIRRWFDTHAFQSVTTDYFLAFVKTHLLDTRPGVVDQAELEAFLDREDVPPFAALPESDAFERVEAAARAWLADPSAAALETLAVVSESWSTHEWVHFIDALPRTLDVSTLSDLDRRFGLSERNAEIAHVWFRLAIAGGYAGAYPALERYLSTIGRRKLIVPLYRELSATPAGRAFAERVYASARPGYHPLARHTIDQMFH
jgi:aminopeptidase N